ncbi:MAG: hypothetical protein ABIV25_13175, partial [Paracoccaceae bacterium]
MRRQGPSASVLFSLLGFALWLTAAIFILPAAAAVLSIYVIYMVARFWRNSPSVRRARNRRQAEILYKKACSLQTLTRAPTTEQFEKEVIERLGELGANPSHTIAKAISLAAG